jgi:NAD+ kinase
MITIDTLSAIADAVQTEIAKIPDQASRGDEICIGADGTPTSRIDKTAENAVLMYLEREGIALNVLSEEIGYVDRGGEETLVLDPIDGSNNAVAGLPYYTVSLAVGKGSLSGIRIAYLRNLVTGESYTAEKGKGAFKDGKRISVRQPDFKRLFIMNYTGRYAHPEASDIARRVKTSRNLGCSSLEIALVAEGKADAFILYSRSYVRCERVVDIAASALILREAGGEIYDIDGNILDMPFDLEHRANTVAVSKRNVFDYLIRGKDPIRDHRFGIYANTSLSKAVDYTQQVMDALKGHEFYVDKQIADVMGIEGIPLKDMDVDVVIVVGGDGTLLRVLQQIDAMVIGINGGSVGFLAEIDRDHIGDGIARLLREDYVIESRFKLRTWYNGEYLKDSVNEALIHTSSVAKIRHYKIYVDDVLACEMRSDGVIISTPTGSTCYAMSLGAPYMDPHVDALMVVPMAAYKSTSRAFVVPATSKITVESVLDKDCVIVLDGQEEIRMEGRTKVDFMLSDKKARFIRFNMDFFSRVREKLVNAL